MDWITGIQNAIDYIEEYIPEGIYLAYETERCQYLVNELDEFYRQTVTRWLPFSGYG